ncbi:hypothetical protein Tco_0029149, partial [Tanacetum coccineum]
EIEEIKEIKKDPTPYELPIVNHYVAPYMPPIPFSGCLKQHSKESLVSIMMESLKEFRVNIPLIKEIRKTNDYAKHMKDLVTNKPKTVEREDVKLNSRCLTILQNQLPTKERGPRSFILPCLIGCLTV